MTEEFLHHVWKFRLFDQSNLLTSTGESVEIEKTGNHNFDSGPDFFNARIRIVHTLWAGNVEVHINSSDWYKHTHHSDKAYENIILHVVYNNDKIIQRSNGEAIPTIELKKRIDPLLVINYSKFKTSKDWIACEKQIASVPDLIVRSTLDKMLIERLERKAIAIKIKLEQNQNNWEETFYQSLARNFGFKVNSEPFELLSRSLSSIYLAKQKNSLLQIEAMLFGQAGMLEKHMNDRYVQQLQNEYLFLKNKFKLVPIEEHLWKFMRLRPVNFPTIRIAQFAGLVVQSSHLFSKIIETQTLNSLVELFSVNVSDYWFTHYQFDKVSVKKDKKLGRDSIENIVINTVIPFLFVYGKQKDDDKYIDRALTFLEQLNGEKNTVIDRWERLRLPVNNAHSTQALLQLKNDYCNFKNCLNCNIGNYLLKKV